MCYNSVNGGGYNYVVQPVAFFEVTLWNYDTKNHTENLDYILKILGTKEMNKAEKLSVWFKLYIMLCSMIFTVHEKGMWTCQVNFGACSNFEWFVFGEIEGAKILLDKC